MDLSYVCYNEENKPIIDSIDHYFKSLALKLGAVEYHIPALINYDVLEKCGYFASFPQHLTVVAHANPDMITQVTEEHEITEKTGMISKQYLTPAACLHIYPMLEGENIETKIITTKARVYRFEDCHFDGATRLWDFTVREIVFVGDEVYVRNKLQYLKEKAIEYAKSIGLPVRMESATDSFYPSKHNIIKQKLQLSNTLKFEMIVPIKGKDIAIASFNFHDTHFSKPFHFDKSGEIVTGCVGFGLERWLEAIRYYQILL